MLHCTKIEKLSANMLENGERQSDSKEMILERALSLIEKGQHEHADMILTSELLFNPSSSDLWLAAGLARLGRKAYRTAHSAFKMSAWLSGKSEVSEMVCNLEEIISGKR